MKLPDPGLMKEATSLTMIFSKIRTGTSGRYQFLVMVWTDPVFIRKQVPKRQIGEIKMPWYTFKHLWTPLEWVGIKLYHYYRGQSVRSKSVPCEEDREPEIQKGISCSKRASSSDND